MEALVIVVGPSFGLVGSIGFALPSSVGFDQEAAVARLRGFLKDWVEKRG